MADAPHGDAGRRPGAEPGRWRRPAADTELDEYLGDPSDLLDLTGFVDQLVDRPAWHADAACREHPDMTWFPGRGDDQQAARDVCEGCLVRAECETYARAQPAWLEGIWGGTSARQRRRRRQGREQPQIAA